jgi:imidazolonepropionase-like amidohydrolase
METPAHPPEIHIPSMKPIPFVAAVLALSCGGGVSAQQPATAALAITHTAVVDVEHGRTLRDQTVVVRGGRITAVGPAARTAIPAGARRVDGRGKFVIPGMWDMHVHAAYPDADRLFMPVLVANGVTGVREMFSRLDWVAATRAKIRDGELLGPRIVASGHIIDGSPAMLPAAIAVRTAAEARHVVDSLAAGGADFIKVYSRLSPEAFAAIADEAKRRGLPFAGHVPGLVPIGLASDAGMASVEHLTGLVDACSPLPPEEASKVAEAVAAAGWDSANAVAWAQSSTVIQRYDPAVCAALARRLVRNGTVMVPTFVTNYAGSFLDDTTLSADPRLRYLRAGISAGWSPRTNPRLRAVPASAWAERHAYYRHQLRIARLLHDNGVRFMAGTDLSTPFTYPGFSLHQELGMLTEIGLSPAEALRAATLEPARFLGIADTAGTVAAGKDADLVLLDANPLADIRNVGRIHAVILRGRFIGPAERERILSRAREIAAEPPSQH